MEKTQKIDIQNFYNPAVPAIKIIKRHGQEVTYRRSHLVLLFNKLLNITDTETLALISQVEQQFEKKIIASDEIRNAVLHVLTLNNESEAVEEYLKFEYEKQKNFERQFDVNIKLQELRQGDKQLLNENANKDSRVYNTTRDLTAGVSAKAVGMAMLPPMVAAAHHKGDIHYHDLDYHPYSPMTNCCLIDFKEMLNNGFHIGNAEVESPKSINTAAAQIAQIIANVASSQYGGCSADRIDEILAPFAKLNFNKHLLIAEEWIDSLSKREEYAYERTKKDIYDAMQSLEYEINTLYTSNGQTPFTTLGFGLGTDWFSRQIQTAILNVRLAGLGKEQRTAIFPKLVFTLKRGVNLEKHDPNYDIKQLAVECATKRMYPDIVNYHTLKDITGSFKVPMGCRSFLQGWKDEQGKEVNSGRMNLGVVTLNVPRIALESNGDMNQFWQIFSERLEVMHDALLYRINRCKEALPENAPILYQHGAFGKRLKESDSVDELFRNKRATISLGYIGLYETAALFFGPTWENNREAKEFTLDILRELKRYADSWGNKYGYHFSVYSTPSESLTDRFCRLDTQKFGVIDHITDKEYYTNSFHYDVRKDPTPFEKIAFEAEYAPLTGGGFIHYCEYPNLRQNPKALEAVWDYAYDLIGYLGTNTPIDHCYECDFKGDFDPTMHGFKCPQCGNTNPETCDVVKRTCGYLGNPQIRPMVKGRHEEIASRVKHIDEADMLRFDGSTETRSLNKESRMRIVSHLNKY